MRVKSYCRECGEPLFRKDETICKNCLKEKKKYKYY